MLAVQAILAILAVYGVYGHVIQEDSMTELRLKREPETDHASEVCGLKPSEKMKLEKDGKEHKLDRHPHERQKGLFQGDIRLTEEQKKIIEEVAKTRNQVTARRGEAVSKRLINHWPRDHAINYYIDPSFAKEQVDVIKEALAHIQKYTYCVTFAKVRDIRNQAGSYIKFMKPTPGKTDEERKAKEKGEFCASELGRFDDTPTQIELSDKCFTMKTILHEIMHAFGFIHEHTRADRDTYVQIMWDNIEKIYHEDFKTGEEVFGKEKYDGNVFGEEYDFDSILHYGLYDGAVDRKKPTIVIKPPNEHLTNLIGQREGLTDADCRKIDRLLRCKQRPTVGTCHNFENLKYPLPKKNEASK